MTKKYFFFLFFLFFIPIIYSQDVSFSCSTLLFNDSFNYTGNLGQPNGFWTSSGATGGCGGADDTQPSLFNTRAFGINGTGFCNSVSSASATLVFPENHSTGQFIFSYNFSSQLHPSAAIDGIQFLIGDKNGRDIYIQANTNAQSTISTTDVGLGGFQDCELSTQYAIPNTGHIVLEMDIDERTYTLYFNGDSNGCRNNIFVNDSYDYALSYIGVTGEYQDSSLAQFYAMSIDDVLVCEGNTTFEVCPFPQLFCDDFNYENSLYNQKGWIVRDENQDLNNQYTPQENKLKWNTTEPKTIQHSIESFEVNYQNPSGFNVYESFLAPSFSNEFTMNISNVSGDVVDIYGLNVGGVRCFDIRLHVNANDTGTAYGGWHVDIEYYNITSEEYEHIGETSINEIIDYKITSRFTSENRSDFYNFNTSYPHNYFELWVNGSAIHSGTELRFNYDCDSIFAFKMERMNDSAIFSMDDYFMYVGLDKFYSSLEEEALGIDLNMSILTPPPDTSDFAQDVADFWDTVGLGTQASKTLFGLALMMIFAIFIVAVFVSRRVPINLGVVAFLEIMFMVFLTFLGLIPVWILIVLGLVSAGLGVFFVKAQIT